MEPIAEMLRPSPDAAHLWNSISYSAQTSVFPGPDPTDVVLSVTEKYPAFFLGTLEYALLPHARRPNFAASFGINNRDIDWKWMATQIETHVTDDAWAHSSAIVKIADIFARTYTMTGNCRFPHYFSKSEAEAWFDSWHSLDERRIGRLGWSSSGSDSDQASLRPSISLFRAIAERNHLRPRRRFLRARRLSSQDDNVDIWEDDVLPVESSGDESILPENAEAPLRLPTYSSLPLSNLDPRLTAQSTERPGNTLESGSTEKPRADRVNPQQNEGTDPQQEPLEERGQQRDVNMEYYSVLPSNTDHIRLALVPREIQNATYLPVAGWPPYRVVFGCGPPAPVLYEASQIVRHGDLDFRTVYDREARGDVVSRALAAAGAVQVDPAGWAMMNEKGDLYSPTTSLDYVVYRLFPRRVRDHGDSAGTWEVRLGPRARGSPWRKYRAPQNMSPGARKASPREIIQILDNPLQMGYPASVNTDACLVSSVIAFQSGDIAHGHCKAYLSTLARIEGRLSKGHDGKTESFCRKGQGRLLPVLHRGHSRGDPAGLRVGTTGCSQTNGDSLMGGIWPLGAATPGGDGVLLGRRAAILSVALSQPVGTGPPRLLILRLRIRSFEVRRVVNLWRFRRLPEQGPKYGSADAGQ